MVERGAMDYGLKAIGEEGENALERLKALKMISEFAFALCT